ncbi:hypothetical protein ACFTUC_25205 [Streptomyces sp. NPDC056944]|uniref:hypothetical protein n=1 Tax=Streptomyces sp. NPDC056944 TaxID=3345972 RepID=UPI003632AC1A
MNADRVRPAVLALAAVALAAVLTGCQDGAAAAGGGAPTAPAATTAAPTAPAPTTAAPTPTTAAPAPTTAKPAPVTTPPLVKKPVPVATKSKGCAESAPSPDEFALYRIEELDGSTGKVNLVVQHGAWGCATGDSDGAPFVGTGEESRWALDQAAYVTATNPIVSGSANRRIGVQELIDWVHAHPDAGLVFRYETGDDGAIHRLEQVFTP